MPWGAGQGNTDAPVIWWQPSCEANFQPTRQPRGTVGVPWDSALTAMAYLFPAHQGRDHTQFRSSAHFCSPNACWCYGQRLFPSLCHLPHRFSPERSLASSVSLSLLLEAQLCHMLTVPGDVWVFWWYWTALSGDLASLLSSAHTMGESKESGQFP